jgi:serine/threonine protein kinase
MTQVPNQEDLREMASRWLGFHQLPHRFRVHTDTTDFFGVEYGDVLLLGKKIYLVRHNAKEQRFGLDDEVKFWVKRAIDLADGSLKIIKLVFHERFIARVGHISFECFRSPRKEAGILNLVRSHDNFMHGFAIEDEKGNLVRVIDHITGKPLSKYVEGMKWDHQSYFHQEFPTILDRFLESIEAIRFLHENGKKHGDIRRDHILIDRNSGKYRWIDFDYNYHHSENVYGYDIFCLGNILGFLVGMKDTLLRDLKALDHPALNTLGDEDMNIVFNNRVANLRKVYPYIPETLNRILMHFSKGTTWFYEDTAQILEDLKEFRKEMH